MYCKFCGAELKADEMQCSNCGKTVYISSVNQYENIEEKNRVEYTKYKELEELRQTYNVNSLLIFCIVEMVCCSRIGGLVAFLIYEIKLMKAIGDNNHEDILKYKAWVIIALCIGLVLGIGSVILSVILEFVSALL